jgi:DDE superfamily endonuclease
MIPTLRTTLGVKGPRPLVGNVDGHDVVDVFAALNLVTGQWTTRLVERLQTAKQPGTSTPRYLQAGCARHLRDIARTYPAAQSPHVVLVIDKAPWPKGAAVTAVLAASPHRELSPLPSYSPQLQVIERFWKVLRRRAPHNRLFRPLAALKTALRNSLCYDQTLKQRVLSVIQSPRKRTKSSAS